MKIPIKEMNELAKRISQGAKSATPYNTGMADEHIIVAAWEMMDLERCIKLRFILNKITQKKKEELAKKIGYGQYQEEMKKYNQYD